MSSEVKLPRGLRNNNPLNIRLSKDKWQGQINAITPNPSFPEGKGNINGNDSSPRGGREGVFCQFTEMKWGWRAAFRLLCHTYYQKYRLRTIRAIITRWAPPNENNTAAYIRNVSDYISIGPDRELGDPKTHPTEWMMLAIAMAVVENGTNKLDYLSMLKGFSLALES